MTTQDEGETATWRETISGDGGPRFVRGREELTLRYLNALEQQARRVPALVKALESMKTLPEIKVLLREHGKGTSDYVPSCKRCQWVDSLIDAEVNDG